MIVVSLQTVGVALVLAILITPAAAAQLLTRRLSTMMLVATVIFVLVFIFALERGLIWRGVNNSRLSRKESY